MPRGATGGEPGPDSGAASGPLRRKSAARDGETIARLQNGDQEALETVFSLYSGKLYSVAQRILGEAADTEEAIQDVFWTVYRKAKTFKGESQFSTWLYRLTVNAALGRARRSKKKKEVEYEEFLPKFQKDGQPSGAPGSGLVGHAR